MRGIKTVGIYFPDVYTNIIGFDLDTMDTDLLNRLYDALINYGIDDENMLISYSGGKGFHLDLFLSGMIDKVFVNKFYKVILGDLRASEKEIELRGGNGQGYKLPLGFHHKTSNYCFACNEWGAEIKDLTRKIQSIKTLDTSIIGEIVEINYLEEPEEIDIILEFEALDNSVKPLEIYQNTNENGIVQVERLIKEGLKEKGTRANSIFKVALYCKDIKGLCLNDTIHFIETWVKNTWVNSIIDKEVYGHIQNIPKSIYINGYRFKTQAENIIITLPEIKEIFSIKTSNKLQTEALRRLYYIFLIHSKAFKDDEGIFFMTYDQMIKSGAVNKSGSLIKQVSKLEELGKLIVIERDRKPDKGFKRKPNKYKLPAFISYTRDVKSFTICDEKEKCKDCLQKALCYLADPKERRKYIKGAEYKKLGECQYNK